MVVKRYVLAAERYCVERAAEGGRGPNRDKTADRPETSRRAEPGRVSEPIRTGVGAYTASGPVSSVRIW